MQSFFLFGLGVAAKTETRAEFVVTVPFGFVVGGKTLPAGTYAVSRLSDPPANYKTDKGWWWKMSCEDIWREVPHYIGGKLSVGVRAAIEEHFKDCKHCIATLGGTGNGLRPVGDAATFDLRAGHSNRADQRRNLKQRDTKLPASNGEALERMKRTSSDLVVLAYRLPQMMGSKLPREIKQINPDIPIILVSGHTLLPSEEMTHVNAYVGKGATLDDLLTRIRVLLAPT